MRGHTLEWFHCIQIYSLSMFVPIIQGELSRVIVLKHYHIGVYNCLLCDYTIVNSYVIQVSVIRASSRVGGGGRQPTVLVIYNIIFIFVHLIKKYSFSNKYSTIINKQFQFMQYTSLVNT